MTKVKITYSEIPEMIGRKGELGTQNVDGIELDTIFFPDGTKVVIGQDIDFLRVEHITE